MSNIASDAKAWFSSKVEYCAVILYLYLKGKTGKEIHGELADFMGRGKQQQAPHGLVMRMLNYILLIANLNIAHIDRQQQFNKSAAGIA